MTRRDFLKGLGMVLPALVLPRCWTGPVDELIREIDRKSAGPSVHPVDLRYCHDSLIFEIRAIGHGDRDSAAPVRISLRRADSPGNLLFRWNTHPQLTEMFGLLNNPIVVSSPLVFEIDPPGSPVTIGVF